MSRHPINRSGHALSPESRELAVELVSEGYSYGQVARLAGVSRHSILMLVRRRCR
jgi:DNA-binding CsgD family transcriptional regulator